MVTKKKTVKKPKAKTTKQKNKKKAKSRKKSKTANTQIDSSIVIVDDELSIDKESVLEERRAYLEEARSQEASD